MEQLGPLIPFVLIAVLFWLLLVRPQRRRALELARTQRGLTAGDQVLLGSGLVATVVDATTDDEFLDVDLAPGVRVKVARAAVVRVLHPVSQPEDGVHPISQPADGGATAAGVRDGDVPPDLRKH